MMYLIITCIRGRHWGLRNFTRYPCLSSKSSGKGSKKCFIFYLLVSFCLNHISPLCGSFVAFAIRSSEITKCRFRIWATFCLSDRENRWVTSVWCPLKLLKKSPQLIFSINWADSGSISNSSLPVGSNIQRGAIVQCLASKHGDFESGHECKWENKTRST